MAGSPPVHSGKCQRRMAELCDVGVDQSNQPTCLPHSVPRPCQNCNCCVSVFSIMSCRWLEVSSASAICGTKLAANIDYISSQSLNFCVSTFFGDFQISVVFDQGKHAASIGTIHFFIRYQENVKYPSDKNCMSSSRHVETCLSQCKNNVTH